MRAFLAVVLLGGCAVAEYPYPLAWAPLGPPPTEGCAAYAGTYADRGERADETSKPSLARQIFGEHADWEEATRVQIAMPDANTLDIAAWSDTGRLAAVSLRADKGQFHCDQGRLRVRSRRWIGGYIMSGRQHVALELSSERSFLVTQVDELTYGVMFIVFPVIGTAKHWYRFPRV